MIDAASRSFQLHFAQVTSATCWVFARVEAPDGVVGWGEATLPGHEAEMRDLAPRFAQVIDTLWRSGGSSPAIFGPPGSLPAAALTSAADMALLDIAGRRADVSVAASLAGSRPLRREIELYANINRRSRERSPTGFVESAEAAVAQGFRALKIAPFDEVRAGGDIEPGLARACAIREAVGLGVELMIDCHWRLTPALAETVIAAAAEIGVHWVECPLPETAETLPAIAALRRLANARGVRLAGCELAIGREGFAPFLREGCYDVMMPDAKYVGGLAEMLALDAEFEAAGVVFSPHNPSGPICHAASLHVCAAASRPSRLEIQFDETPAFDDIQVDALPRPVGGVAAMPDGPGLGVALRSEALAAVAIHAA